MPEQLGLIPTAEDIQEGKLCELAGILPREEFLLLRAIHHYVRQKKAQRVQISRTQIFRVTMQARTTIFEAAQSLKAKGLIDIQQQYAQTSAPSAARTQKPNVYQISWLGIEELIEQNRQTPRSPGERGGVAGRTGGGRHTKGGGSPGEHPPFATRTPHDHEVLRSGSNESKTHDHEAPSGRSDWPAEIRKEDLGNPETVERLYRIAVGYGWMPDTDLQRVRFFAQARYCRLKGRNPGALFTSSIKRGIWKYKIEDEEKARAAIRWLEGQHANV